MNRKNLFFTFLFFWGICGIFSQISAQELDFYSQIDDAGNTVAEQLTARHLEEFSDFKNFWKHCRKSRNASWLDQAPMDQQMLEEISQGNIGSLQKLAAEQKSQISSEEMLEIQRCLASEYGNMKSQALREQKSLENVGSTSIFMDGSLENSDFDIIEDINKINAIIFTSPVKYEGTKNMTHKSLLDFFKWKKAPTLKDASEKNNQNSENSQSSNTTTENKNPNSQTNNNNNQTSTNTTENILPWTQMCGADGKIITTTSIANMVDENFARDLNNALSGKKNYNHGSDYSAKPSPKNGQNNQNNFTNRDESEENATNTSENDYASKLPCSDTFCITFGSNISKLKALKGGNSFAIESILDKHIKRVNPISWWSLAGQKMTNNSYQLPFLNLKFDSQVSGGAVFLHNTPQVTSIHKETPENIEDQFELAYRCALMEAGLSTDEYKNGGISGTYLNINDAHNTEKFQNSTKPGDPIENNQNLNCQDTFQNYTENRHYEGFSTQVNEIQAFTDAMMSIINQILDAEKRLDTVKQI